MIKNIKRKTVYDNKTLREVNIVTDYDEYGTFAKIDIMFDTKLPRYYEYNIIICNKTNALTFYVYESIMFCIFLMGDSILNSEKKHLINLIRDTKTDYDKSEHFCKEVADKIFMEVFKEKGL